MLHYFEIGFNWNFKSGIFCTLPVSGMCCSPVYTHTHNSTAEWRWIEGGVNDLTEDSVELTPATEQTICSFHQQLWSKKKKKTRRGWEEMSYKTQRGWGGGFDEKVCGCRMQQLSRTWLRFWGDLLVRGNLSGSFSFIPNRRTTVALLPELIMFGARKQLLNSNDKSFIGCNAYKFITQSDRETVLNWLCAFVFHRSREKHQPGQSPEPETLCWRLSQIRQLLKHPTDEITHKGPTAWEPEGQKKKR